MYILFVGQSGVPYKGTASDMRLCFFANTLCETNQVMILNRYLSKLSYKSLDSFLDKSVQVKEIIASKKTGRFSSLFLFLLSVFIEPFSILKINMDRHVDVIHLYSGHYVDMFFYFIIAKIIRAKLIYQYVEYRSEIERGSRYHKINGWLCDYKGALLWDGVIPISNFLKEKALEINSRLKWIKVTPLCDFNFFDKITGVPDINAQYLLFCGSVGYCESISLIISSYERSIVSEKCKLVMILSGSNNQLDSFKSQHPNVIVKTRLTYEELVIYYKNATALLIPLNNTIRDIARFPNKICEYTASRGAVITTNTGEVRNYFVDGENAIVADDFSVESYSAKMDEFLNGKYDLERIKRNAYNTGRLYFDIASYKKSLDAFFSSLFE